MLVSGTISLNVQPLQPSMLLLNPNNSSYAQIVDGILLLAHPFIIVLLI